MKILHEAKEFVVAVKPAGMLSEEGEGSFPSALKEYFAAQGTPCAIFPVHRLDRAVSGVMVYAKTKKAAAMLSAPGTIAEKSYLTVVKGKIEDEENTLRDLLLKDGKSNKVFVVNSLRKGVKEAVLHYRKRYYDADHDLSLLSVTLQTGRSHQIRVQLASRKHPVVGDGKYGGGDNAAKQIALFSHSISFFWKEKLLFFSALPSTDCYPFSLFSLPV